MLSWEGIDILVGAEQCSLLHYMSCQSATEFNERVRQSLRAVDFVDYASPVHKQGTQAYVDPAAWLCVMLQGGPSALGKD